MAAKGYYRNPSTRSCFEVCASCFRCQARRSNMANGVGTPCSSCSGHHDARGEIDPHPDDFCDCTNGVMRWVSMKGHLIVKRFPNNPFQGTIKSYSPNPDEDDWKSYLDAERERLQDPDYDPIDIYDSAKDPYAYQEAEARKRSIK